MSKRKPDSKRQETEKQKDSTTQQENTDPNLRLDEDALDELDGADFEDGGDSDSEETDETAGVSPLVVERLQKMLSEKDEQLDRTLNAYRREKAEMDRFKERLERDRERKIDQEKTKVFSTLFDPLDVLQRSIEEAEKGGDPKAVLEGLKLVHRQVVSGLKSVGLTQFVPMGEPFDPEYHDALLTQPVDSKAQDNTVILVTKAGYTLNGQVVRPAQVIVGKYGS